MYADIIVDISAENVDKTYQYLIPEALEGKVSAGTQVSLSFGNRKNDITGYVVGLSDRPKIPVEKIKPIKGICSGQVSIDDRMIALAAWIREQFGSTMNEALKVVLPVKRKVQPVLKRQILPAASREIVQDAYSKAVRKHYAAKERLLAELLSEFEFGLDYNLVNSKLNISAQTINSLEADGIIRIESEKIFRNPIAAGEVTGAVFDLNEGQKRIADSIIDDIRNGKRDKYLLHGITGSGKTEVYMAVIEEVVKRGEQVIMLIPEISLTYQTVKRFYRRFGDNISIMNSKLSAGERYDQYLKAREGLTSIVIGPRSAIFTPFDRLGLIIIDEEHEASYKSESSPRYQTRDVAFRRAETEGAAVILGSATPSLESYSAAEAGRIKLFEMTERAGGAALPSVSVVDLRDEMSSGNRSMFSRRLQELMVDRLNKNEQIMLFLNRRGHSGFVNCRSCGEVIKCPHCDVSLTYHNEGKLVCHYCGYSIDMYKKCPSCGSPYIKSFGLGTQKVEEQLKKALPGVRVLRMDADTTRAKDGYDEILSKFSNHEADILVGTQMIVKGHDFHKVTLVGILLADMSLYSSDYQSGERTYQLLVQASGRAGRGQSAGDVVIQTYNPEHYAITAAAKNDFKGFYKEEMAFRRLMNYPPSWNMLRITCLSKNETVSVQEGQRVKKLTDSFLSYEKEKGMEIKGAKLFGPAPEEIFRINDVYRTVFSIKSPDYGLLVRIKDYISEFYQANPVRDLSVQVDFK